MSEFVDTTYFREIGHYKERAKSKGITLLHVKEIPTYQPTIDVLYENVEDKYNFFDFAKEKKVNFLMYEIIYYDPDNFIDSFEELCPYLFTISEEEVDIASNIVIKHCKQFQTHKKGEIACYRFMFIHEGIQYVMQINQDWYDEFLKKKQSLSQLIYSHNEKERERINKKI